VHPTALLTRRPVAADLGVGRGHVARQQVPG
jgi:hypothetical protein